MITRSSIIAGANNELQLIPQPSGEQIAKDISLVYPVHIKYSEISKRSVSGTSANATVYTTPSDKTFYLTYIMLSVVKDAANDNILVYVAIPQYGYAIPTMTMQFNTTTATSKDMFITFPHPIKCDRNSAITLVGTFTAGTMSKHVVIGGFLME